jgi:hypothetical protein
MKRSDKPLFGILWVLSFVAILASCSSPEKKEETTRVEDEEVIEEAEKAIAEEDFQHWQIHEDGYGEVRLRAEKEVDEQGKKMKKMEPITHEELKEKMEPHYVAYHTEVEITESIIPVMETETLTAYNKKGKEKGTIQVVHDSQTGEVISVAYRHNNHTDEYDVTTGMTAKEVKKLRKEMKHMKHRGEYFLYSDVSNIMYILDVKDSEGQEYTEAEMDEMVVQAIVWKDKKHHDDMISVEFLEN